VKLHAASLALTDPTVSFWLPTMVSAWGPCR